MPPLHSYTLAIYEGEPDEEGYWAEVLELPGCVAQGESLDELRQNAMDAITAWVSTKNDLGDDVGNRYVMTMTLPA